MRLKNNLKKTLKKLYFFIYLFIILLFSFCIILNLTLLTGCKSGKVIKTSQTDLFYISIKDIIKNPDSFKDKYVVIKGYGVITATFPLPPGYIGLDKRTVFVDSFKDKIIANIEYLNKETLNLDNLRLYDPENLREFEGYIRIFSGQIGAPVSIKYETFPYFEIRKIKLN